MGKVIEGLFPSAEERNENIRRGVEIGKQKRAARKRELATYHAGKRRAAKLQRTPPWANHDAIKALYAEARRMTEETGITYHVDHIIPLLGESVSGLHVEANLQVIEAAENIRKHNHYSAD